MEAATYAPALQRLLPCLETTARSCRLLEGVTPLNWHDELRRLTGARRRGQRVKPRFVFPEPHPHLAASIKILDTLAHAFDELSDHPATQLACRAREIAQEARLLQSVGSNDFLALAKQRYTSTPEADDLAATWARLSPDHDDAKAALTVASDDERSPHSLLNQLRRTLYEMRLPVRVVVRVNLAPLAATGHGIVYIASGRPLAPRVVARTVLHEVQGHVVPGQQRAPTPWPLALRPPGSVDHEEGYALRLEESAGYLDATRKKELGLRHRAACLAHAGSNFHDIADALEHDGAPLDQAVSLTARALRGGGWGESGCI